MTEGEDTTVVLVPSWKRMDVERFLPSTKKIEMASMHYKQGYGDNCIVLCKLE